MYKNSIQVVTYFIKTQSNPRWLPKKIAATRENADVLIKEYHPDLLEYKIIVYSSVKSLSTDGEPDISHLLSRGWSYDMYTNSWLMPNEVPERPTITLTPAEISIQTEKPDVGWWYWTVNFNDAQCIDGRVQPLNDIQKLEKSIIHDIRCSNVFDPVPDLHIFVNKIKATLDALWQVDEEGCYVTMVCWYINSYTVHLRMYSSLYRENYCCDYLLDRDSFLKTIKAAYHSFGRDGGWGDFGDNDNTFDDE